MLEEQKISDVLTVTMEDPQGKAPLAQGDGTLAQGGATLEQLKSCFEWKKRNFRARIMMLSSMRNDLMFAFTKITSTKVLWETLKNKYGSSSMVQLKRLTLQFENFKMNPQYMMRQHILEMSNMILQLQTAGHILLDEQQVVAMIRSLLDLGNI